MRKEDIKVLVVIVIICLICFALVFLFNIQKNTNDMELVHDYNEYFNVIEEVNNYINYISDDSTIGVYNLLYDKYISSNNINYDNLFNYVNKYAGLCSLGVEEIYFVQVDDNYLYYVNGVVLEDDYDNATIVDDNFSVVVLNDVSNNTYAIYPLKGNDNYKKIINSIENINIDSNSVNKSVNDLSFYNRKDICKMYFADFMSKLYNNIDGAYKKLDNAMLKQYSSLSAFNEYIDTNIKRFSSLTKSCEYSNGVYYVVDSKDNNYTITEEAVMKYRVSFNLK